MALEKKLEKENNEYKIDFNNVYFKIDSAAVDPIKETIRVGLRGYPDKYSRTNGGIGIYKKVFELKFTDINPESFSKNDILTAVYEYIKSLDDYKESKDV